MDHTLIKTCFFGNIFDPLKSKFARKLTIFNLPDRYFFNELCLILQLYVLKPEEGGSKMPLANYFREHIFSLTWDAASTLEIVGKDFIMPGENAE